MPSLYFFLCRWFGPRTSLVLTATALAFLVALVILFAVEPQGEFRYGNI